MDLNCSSLTRPELSALVQKLNKQGARIPIRGRHQMDICRDVEEFLSHQASSDMEHVADKEMKLFHDQQARVKEQMSEKLMYLLAIPPNQRPRDWNEQILAVRMLGGSTSNAMRHYLTQEEQDQVFGNLSDIFARGNVKPQKPKKPKKPKKLQTSR